MFDNQIRNMKNSAPDFDTKIYKVAEAIRKLITYYESVEEHELCAYLKNCQQEMLACISTDRHDSNYLS